MSNDENSRASSDIKRTFDDVVGFIKEHPRLALPLGVGVAILALATMFKTLIDGFDWVYTAWHMEGVLWVVGIVVVVSLGSIFLTGAALSPRPVIKPFPASYRAGES